MCLAIVWISSGQGSTKTSTRYCDVCGFGFRGSCRQNHCSTSITKFKIHDVLQNSPKHMTLFPKPCWAAPDVEMVDSADDSVVDGADVGAWSAVQRCERPCMPYIFFIFMGVDLNSFIRDPSFLANKTYVSQAFAFLRFIFRRSMLCLCLPCMLYDGYHFVLSMASSVLAGTR